jgi:hypothetical protein
MNEFYLSRENPLVAELCKKRMQSFLANFSSAFPIEKPKLLEIPVKWKASPTSFGIENIDFEASLFAAWEDETFANAVTFWGAEIHLSFSYLPLRSSSETKTSSLNSFIHAGGEINVDLLLGQFKFQTYAPRHLWRVGSLRAMQVNSMLKLGTAVQYLESDIHSFVHFPACDRWEVVSNGSLEPICEEEKPEKETKSAPKAKSKSSPKLTAKPEQSIDLDALFD